jgi:NNP family nitrate/nitrite transporter-like MFS transporter
MIPAIFRAKLGDDLHEARRLSSALIGLAGAIGAFGGVLVNIAFRESFLRTGQADGAYVSFIAFYGVCVLVTWAVYLRPGRRLPGV